MISRTMRYVSYIYCITIFNVSTHNPHIAPHNHKTQETTPTHRKTQLQRRPSQSLLRNTSHPSVPIPHTARSTTTPDNAPVPLHEQYKRIRNMIYEYKNDQLINSCSHMMRQATSYATVHGLPTPLDHINMSHNTQLLHTCLQVYRQPDKKIPHIVRYRGIVTAIQNDQKHVEMLLPHCLDTINIALYYKQLTPIHHAVASRNVHALNHLLQYAYNSHKALETRQDFPKFNAPVTPRELAQNRCPECVALIDRFLKNHTTTDQPGSE